MLFAIVFCKISLFGPIKVRLRHSRQERLWSTPKEVSAIRFLVSCSRTWPTKLLGLTSSVICYQQRSIILHQRLFQLVLGVLIDEFLVVCDN